jgi:hypothetical protein
MNWFLLNMPLAAAFFAAWAGIPLWLVFKHPDQNPGLLAGQAAQHHQISPAGLQATPAAQRSNHLADAA